MDWFTCSLVENIFSPDLCKSGHLSTILSRLLDKIKLNVCDIMGVGLISKPSELGKQYKLFIQSCTHAATDSYIICSEELQNAGS